jgi:hypothetical protein
MSQVTFGFEHPDSMLEKLYFLPSSMLSQIRHLRIHYAYLDLDTTSEAHKLLNNRYPKWLEQFELPASLMLLSGLRLETITVQGWEF